MFRKFLSRKFLYPIAYGLVTMANSKYSLNLPVTEIAGCIIAFIVGESAADVMGAKRSTK